MARFDAYKPILFKVEGGYQNIASDPGNFNSLGERVGTNYGISARFYESVIGRPPTKDDMLAITRREAEDIYKHYFWDALRASEINNQAVANTIVDQQINAGNGGRMAQSVLNDVFNKGLAVDGIIGPKSLKALNAVHANAFLKSYNQRRKDWYLSLPHSGEWGHIWLNRLAHFEVPPGPQLAGFGSGAIALFLLYFGSQIFKNV